MVETLNAEIKERIEMINKGEVPEGYKKTKVGVIPNEWEIRKLGDISNFRQGYQIPSSEQFITSNGGYIRYLYISDFISDSNKTYVKKLKGYYIVEKNDICIANTGNTGGKAFRGKRGVLSNNMFKIFNKTDTIVNNFYWFFLNSWFYWKQLLSLFNLGGQPHVGHKNMSRIIIKLPPVAEQQKTAQILSTWDKAIELKGKLIEQKKEQKKGLMQKLLTGEVRLPGFDGEWEEVRLNKLLDYEQPNKYITNNITEYNKDLVPVLTANKSFILGSTVDDEGIYTDLPVIIFDDFTTDNKYVEFPFKIKSSAIKILKTKTNHADLRFIYELMQLIKFPTGGHKRHYISEYQYIKAKVPCIQEQKSIAQILSTADKEINLLTKELDLLKQQKKGLMQLLLTGIVRVK